MNLGIIGGYERGDFEYAKSKGMKFLEFCINVGSDVGEFLRSQEAIMASIRETGVAVGSIGRWGTDRLNQDGTINQSELDIDKSLVAAAAKLSCPVYVMGCNYIEDFSFNKNCSLAIEYFMPIVQLGKALGVKVAAYNCRWNNFVCDPKAWSAILEALPDLYIKYDPSHCITESDEDFMQEVMIWGHRIAHIHIKGVLMVNGKFVDAPPAGLDCINWRAFMGLLHAVGYEGGLSIEPHSETWSGEKGARGVDFTIQYISGLMV